ESEPKALVQLEVVRRAELSHRLAVDASRIEVDRIELFVGQTQSRLLEAAATVAVGFVRDHRPQHAEGNALAVDDGFELGLDLGESLLMRAGEVAEEALAGEAPELGRRSFELLCRLELRQLLVAFVD